MMSRNLYVAITVELFSPAGLIFEFRSVLLGTGKFKFAGNKQRELSPGTDIVVFRGNVAF